MPGEIDIPEEKESFNNSNNRVSRGVARFASQMGSIAMVAPFTAASYNACVRHTANPNLNMFKVLSDTVTSRSGYVGMGLDWVRRFSVYGGYFALSGDTADNYVNNGLPISNSQKAKNIISDSFRIALAEVSTTGLVECRQVLLNKQVAILGDNQHMNVKNLKVGYREVFNAYKRSSPVLLLRNTAAPISADLTAWLVLGTNLGWISPVIPALSAYGSQPLNKLAIDLATQEKFSLKDFMKTNPRTLFAAGPLRALSFVIGSFGFTAGKAYFKDNEEMMVNKVNLIPNVCKDFSNKALEGLTLPPPMITDGFSGAKIDTSKFKGGVLAEEVPKIVNYNASLVRQGLSQFPKPFVDPFTQTVVEKDFIQGGVVANVLKGTLDNHQLLKSSVEGLSQMPSPITDDFSGGSIDPSYVEGGVIASNIFSLMNKIGNSFKKGVRESENCLLCPFLGAPIIDKFELYSKVQVVSEKENDKSIS